MDLHQMRDAMFSYWKKDTDREAFVDSLFEFFEKPREEIMHEEMNHFCCQLTINSPEIMCAKITDFVTSLQFKSKQHLMSTLIFIYNSKEDLSFNDSFTNFINAYKDYAYNRIMENDCSQFLGFNFDSVEFFFLVSSVSSETKSVSDLVINLYCGGMRQKYSKSIYKICNRRRYFGCNLRNSEDYIEQLTQKQFEMFNQTLASYSGYFSCNIYIKKCIEYNIKIDNVRELLRCNNISDDYKKYLINFSGPTEYNEEIFKRFMTISTDDSISLTKLSKVLYNDENQFDKLVKDLYLMIKGCQSSEFIDRIYNICFGDTDEDKHISCESITDLILLLNQCIKCDIGYRNFKQLLPEKVTSDDIKIDLSDPHVLLAAMYLYQESDAFYDIIKEEISKLALPSSLTTELVNEVWNLCDRFGNEFFENSIETRNFIQFVSFYVISRKHGHKIEIPFEGKLLTFFCACAISTYQFDIPNGLLKDLENDVMYYLDRSDPLVADDLTDYIIDNCDRRDILEKSFFHARFLSYTICPHHQQVRNFHLIPKVSKYFSTPELLQYLKLNIVDGNIRDVVHHLKKQKCQEMNEIYEFINNFFDIGRSMKLDDTMYICKKLMKLVPNLLDGKEDDLYEYLDSQIQNDEYDSEVCYLLEYLAPFDTDETKEDNHNRFDFDERNEDELAKTFKKNERFWNIFMQVKDKIIDTLSCERKIFKNKKNIFKNIKNIEMLKQSLVNNSKRPSYANLKIRRENLLDDAISEFKEKIEKDFYNINVKYKKEEGVDGGGLSRDFITNVSKIIFNPDFGLFVASPSGKCLIPNKNNIDLEMFRFAGKFSAIALNNMHLINANLCNSFFELICDHQVPVSAIKLYDESIFESMKYIFENDVNDLDLRFSISVDGEDEDLIENGANIEVNEDNKREYLINYVEALLIRPFKSQMEAFVEGFRDIYESSDLSLMTADEIRKSLCGEEKIDLDDMEKNLDYCERGDDIKGIEMMMSILRSWTPEDVKKFVFFVTGSQTAPVGGFSCLRSKMSVSFSNRENNNQNFPTAGTCSCSLYFYGEQTRERMERELKYVINVTSFGLG